MVKRKDMLNERQILPFRRWCHGPLFFLHIFLHFVLLFMLYHSGNIAIPRDRLFFLLHILHLVLFKSPQCQGDMSISVDSRVVFWWARYVNRRLSFRRRADLPFFQNGFVAIYFQPSVSKSYPPRATTMCWGLRLYRWQVNTFRYIWMCHWPRRWYAI